MKHILLLGCRSGLLKAVLFETEEEAEKALSTLPEISDNKYEWDKENSTILMCENEI